MGAVMRWRRAAGLPWRRATSGEPRPPRLQAKSGPAAHLSGQPGGRLMNASLDEPKAIAGGLHE